MGFFNAIMFRWHVLSFQRQRGEFYEQLARGFENKEGIRDFIESELAISRDPQTQDLGRAAVLASMLQRLAQGVFNVSELLGPYVPRSDLMMLSAVDASPNKPATLRALVAALEDQAKAKKILMGAVVTPVILLPGMFALAWVIAAKAIPAIEKVAPPSLWTPFNSSIRFAANLVRDWGPTFVVAVILFICAIAWALPRVTAQWRIKSERVKPMHAALGFLVAPWVLPMSLYRDMQVSMLLSSLSVLLQAGHTLTSALETVRGTASPWMRWHLTRVLVHLQDNPTEYVEAFAKGLLSRRMLARMATTIRTTKGFNNVLTYMGTTGNEEMRQEIGRSANSLKAVLLVSASLFTVYLYVGNLWLGQDMSKELDPSTQLQRKAAASARR